MTNVWVVYAEDMTEPLAVFSHPTRAVLFAHQRNVVENDSSPQGSSFWRVREYLLDHEPELEE